MQNSLLQRSLKILSPKEIRRFNDFIASPYLNSNAKATIFWQAIKEKAPDFEISDKEKQAIFQKIFGRKKFDDALYRNLTSDLFQLLLNFIAFESFQEKPSPLLYWKATSQVNRAQYELLEKTLKNIETEIKNQKENSDDVLEMKVWLERFSHYYMRLRYRGKHEAIAEVRFQEYINSILHSALSRIFRTYENILRAEEDYRKPYDRKGLELCMELYTSGAFGSDPLVEVAYLMLKLRISNDEKVYFSLKKIFLDSERFSKGDRINIAVSLVTFLATKIEAGDENRREELFEVYEYELNNQLWHEKRPLTYIAFINIVSNSLALGKIAYCRNFITHFSDQIASPVKEDIINLSLGWLAFYEHDLDRSISFITSIQTENVMIKYELRSLQAMIWYKLNETETLDSLLESFRHFISYNQQVSDQIKNSRLNFCKYLSKISRLRSDPDRKNGKKLMKLLGSESGVYMGSWLLAEVRKLV